MQPLESLNELTQQLEALGWVLLSNDSKSQIAKAKGPGGQRIQAIGLSPEMRLLGLLNRAERSNSIRAHAAKEAAWKTNWLADKDLIARDYADLPDYNNDDAAAWHILANELHQHADHIRRRINVEETDEPHPYTNADELSHDVKHNQHYFLTRHGLGNHPVWTPEQEAHFRLVHDIVGHANANAGYDWHGVNESLQHHMPVSSDRARQALFMETVGRKAYEDTYPGYAGRKIALLPQHVRESEEGKHVVVPQVFAKVVESIAMPNEYPDIDPDTPVDPNADWQSPYHNSPEVLSGSPGDYLNREEVYANANKLNDPDQPWWTRDPDTQKRAILNAFKVSILSPMKHLKWNAAHYQGLIHADPHASARELWDIVDDIRENHNQSLGAMPGEHIGGVKALAKPLVKFYESQGEHPAQAWRHAKDMIYRETAKVEQELKVEYTMQGKDESDLRLFLDARAIVEQWVHDLILSQTNGDEDQMSMFMGDENESEREPEAYTSSWHEASEKLGWGFKRKGPDPNETQRLEWENGISNDWPQGFNPLDSNLCPHCGRAKDANNPEAEFCPICQHSYAEQPNLDTMRTYGIHPDQYPDEFVQPHVEEAAKRFRALDRIPGNGAAFYYDPARKALYNRATERLNEPVDPRIADWAKIRGGQNPTGEPGSYWQILRNLGATMSDKLNRDQNYRILRQNPSPYDLEEIQNGRLTRLPAEPPKQIMPYRVTATELDYDPASIDPAGGKKYGGFMGGHIEAIAAISPYLDKLRQYALKDIKEDGGRGFIWRQGVKHLDVPGVDDKVASFAWLVLAPTSSDLTILDRHALRGLGYDGESARNSKEYYALERAQKALRDASGYGDMSQGLYHWGKWDLIRTPGHVSDHSPFRPLDPEPWYDVKWPESPPREKDEENNWKKTSDRPWIGPPELEAARDAADQAYTSGMAELTGKPPRQMLREHWGTSPEMPEAYNDRTSSDAWLDASLSAWEDEGGALNTQARTAMSKSEKLSKLKRYLADMSPSNENDAKKLGQEAAGLKLSKKDFEKFLSVHDEMHENLGGWKKFKRESLKAFDDIPSWQRSD